MNDNKEPITNAHLIGEVLSLCCQIQTKGVGTMFCDFSGHTTGVRIALHTPEWKGTLLGESYSKTVYSREPEAMQEAIDELKQILEHGEDGIPGFLETKNKRRKEAQAMIKKLQQELKNT